MAINTIKATILMRHGLKKDFDPDQMTTGEWAVSIDQIKENQIVWMCFAPGIVKRMGTYDDFEAMIAEATGDIRNQYIVIFNEINEATAELEESARKAAQAAQESKEAAASSASQASQSAGAAEDYSKESESHSHGGTGTRPGEDTDNSLYYSQQSKLEYERAKEEADRAEAFSGFVKPNFLLANNRLYLKRGSTVSFIIENNRLYYKISA